MISTLYLTPIALLTPPCDTDATTSRNCFCSDGELVQMLTRGDDRHLLSSGWGAGNREAEILMMPGGGGEESLSQH